MFRDDNANIGTATPSTNSNSPITKACKLHSVQGKPNKKLEKKKRRLSTCSFAIADAINNFTHLMRRLNLKNGDDKIHHISNVAK